MVALELMTVAVIYVTSFAILLVGYLTAISSKDVIRLLISLEMMFGAVFLVLIPLFSAIAHAAFGIAVVTIFASSGELLILISAIVILDRQRKSIHTGTITIGGDRL